MEKFFLTGGYYGFFLFILGFYLLLIFRQQKPLLKLFLTISRKSWWILAFILLLGLLFRLKAPWELLIYYDEYYYIAAADNLKTQATATFFWGARGYGGVGGGERHNFSHFYPPYPQGWAGILSLFFRVFPAGMETARLVNLLFSLLSIAGVFLLAWLLWEDEQAACFSALFLAVLPVHIKLTPTAAAEISSCFFLIMAGIFLLCCLKLRDKYSLWLSLFAFGVYLQFRPENLLTLPLYLAAAWGVLNLGSIFLLLLFILPILVIYFSAFLDPQLKTHFLPVPRPGLSGVKGQALSNLLNNFKFFLDNQKHPILLTLGALLGGLKIRAAGTKEKKLVVFLFAWFLLFFIFYLPYPFGDFACRHSLDSWRSSLNLYLPLLLLFGGGIKALKGFKKSKILPALLFLMILATPFLNQRFIYSWQPLSQESQVLLSLSLLPPPGSQILLANQDYALFLYYENQNQCRIKLLNPQTRFKKIPKEPFYLIAGEQELDFELLKDFNLTYLTSMGESQKITLFKLNLK